MTPIGPEIYQAASFALIVANSANPNRDGSSRFPESAMPKSKNPPGGIDLITLRLLIAACEEGNLARAAARENIAVSAVSRRISDLEAKFGVQLLHRHDRGIKATAAAELVLPRIRGLFDLLGQVSEDLRKVSNGERGLIRIQAHMTAAASSLPAQIAAFLERRPGIEVEFDEATSSSITYAVRVGLCDIGLVSGTVDGGDLELIPWAEDELVAVLPPDSDLRDHAKLQLEDMLDTPFIGMQRDSALLTMYRSQAAALGRTLHERAHVTSFESVRKMVGLGLGVAILPAIVVRPFASSDNIVVRPLAEAWARRALVLCVRNREQAPAATRLLIDFLLADRGPAREAAPPDQE